MKWMVTLAVLVGVGACGTDVGTGGEVDAADGAGAPWAGGDAGELLDSQSDDVPVRGDGTGGEKPDGVKGGDGAGGQTDSGQPDAGLTDTGTNADAAAPADGGGAHPDSAAPPADGSTDGTGGGTDGDTPVDAGGADADVAAAPAYQVQQVSTSSMDPWAEVRHLVVDHEGLVEEPHTARTHYTDPAIVDAFGAEEPGPGHLLLHVSTGCTKGAKRVAVLVPGAGSDAQTSWASPPPLYTGLAQRLVDAGVCVYAITFAQPFGDNLNQAIVLAAAVEQARLETGVATVAAIGHSKGGIVAVAYVNGLAAERGAPFAGDVDRLILLGTPLGGTDWTFRHPAFNLPTDLWALPMPGSWDQILEWGLWTDASEDSVYGPAFRGIAQMTARWDEAYPLSMLEQDWYTTYEGGWGFVSHSLGIDAAIELGGEFMERLHTHQVPGSVLVSIAAGGNPSAYGVLLENTGPADGLVFIDSATETSLFELSPEVDVLQPLSHWELVASETAQVWVVARVAP